MRSFKKVAKYSWSIIIVMVNIILIIFIKNNKIIFFAERHIGRSLRIIGNLRITIYYSRTFTVQPP